MKQLSIIGLLFFFVTSFGQKKGDFGILTQAEKSFQGFESDTTASAVYLFEQGKNYFEIRNNYIYLITEYHAKIKILKKEGFGFADIEIPFYQNKNSSEKVQKIKAITHNGNSKTFIKEDNIYRVDKNENWSNLVFTFPDVGIGSILEYSYEVQSPFHFNLSGWNFQSEIPKIYSEYNAKIPGNWVYNRSLIGELKLDVDEANLRKDCFYIAGYGSADCEVLKYVMKDVPAFEDSEEFMLSPTNYRSRLEFELSEYHNLKGYTEKYTKTWKDVDKEFKTDKDLGRQLKKKNFFENNVPLDLLKGNDELSTAKEIYAFVKNHYTWNGKYGVWRNNSVKKAFDEKKGNVSEINISLINLLNSAGLKAEMMLLGTRKRGLPKRSHPVMSDFNYLIAKVDVNGQTYLLDAAEKEMPFDMLPFRCLNYYGRVMDFDNESYWFDIVPKEKSKKVIRAQMEIDTDNGIAIGKFNTLSKGYDAVSEWKSIKSSTEQEYLDKLEEDIRGDFYITSHKVLNERSNESTLLQQFGFEIENIAQNGDIYLNPNIIKFFPVNPFLSSKRHYPIDFGYPRDYSFNLSLKIPEGYRLKSLPDEKSIALPQNIGSVKFQLSEVPGKSVSVLFDLKLNATHYKSEIYQAVKEFFQHAVEAQNNSYLVLEKI